MLCSLIDVLKIKSVYKHVRWTTSKFHLRELLQLKSYIYFFPGFRLFEADSFLGFSLYVSITPDIKQATLCFKDINFTTNTIPPVFNITCPVHGQYVIYLTRDENMLVILVITLVMLQTISVKLRFTVSSI